MFRMPTVGAATLPPRLQLRQISHPLEVPRRTRPLLHLGSATIVRFVFDQSSLPWTFSPRSAGCFGSKRCTSSTCHDQKCSILIWRLLGLGPFRSRCRRRSRAASCYPSLLRPAFASSRIGSRGDDVRYDEFSDKFFCNLSQASPPLHLFYFYMLF
nr:uncharacterized protein LOC127325723 isoform X4 [Lolium perenne]